MKSDHHQFLEFADQVKKRYIRRRIEPLTGYRLNPRNAVNPNERIDFLLATPDEDVSITPWEEGKPTEVKQTKFNYENEVLELYTDTEVKAFERMNRLLFENGLLVEYEEQAPEIDKVNVLTNSEIHRLVKLRTTELFRQRIKELSSVFTLQELLKAMEVYEDTKHSHMKIVQERINDINTSTNT